VYLTVFFDERFSRVSVILDFGNGFSAYGAHLAFCFLFHCLSSLISFSISKCQFARRVISLLWLY
jgi:hypothetical protein